MNIGVHVSFSIPISLGDMPGSGAVGSTASTFSGSVQSLSRVWLFATPWTIARQASLSITNSRNLLKLMSIESVTTTFLESLYNYLFGGRWGLRGSAPILQLWRVGSRTQESQLGGFYFPGGKWDASSPSRDWPGVPCISRQILSHWTSREISTIIF